jgi:acyl-coenzyme A thioesterase PaaI-like protein
MGENNESPGARIRSLWQRLAPVPGGRWLFSRIVGWTAPYSGTVRPRILELEPGFARVCIRDRRRVRNHLNSIHAMALANIAEQASGLAMLAGLPEGMRAILTGFSIMYLKKARGTVTAECRCTLPDDVFEGEHEFESVVSDAEGAVVARAVARWCLGSNPA